MKQVVKFCFIVSNDIAWLRAAEVGCAIKAGHELIL
jgi:hypothetical protein